MEGDEEVINIDEEHLAQIFGVTVKEFRATVVTLKDNYNKETTGKYLSDEDILTYFRIISDSFSLQVKSLEVNLKNGLYWVQHLIRFYYLLGVEDGKKSTKSHIRNILGL